MNYISVTELSEHLNIPRVTAYLYLRKKIFPYEKIAGKIVINRESLPGIEATFAAHRRFKGVSA
ncbi:MULTISPECIES: helix-turn-helix domain-containing protein [unclassified Gluconobacter]|uniref:helix-turn-helix domain-containing protein n=1 Tax=unclassified Gluconobacter TaxID=2644261 RepID=UPI001C05C04F